MNLSPSKKRTITSITCGGTKPLNSNFPSLFRLYRAAERAVAPLLRRFVSRLYRFMDSLLLTYSSFQEDDVFSINIDQSYQSPESSDSDDSLYLVSFSWWKEALCDGGVAEAVSGVGGVLYSATARLNRAGDENDEEVMWGSCESEILVDMRRQGELGNSEEVGVSGSQGNFALISEWMFLKALKWHCDVKDAESLLPGEKLGHDLFSLQIKLLSPKETNLLVIKISRKDNDSGSFSKAYNIFCSMFGSLQIWDFSGHKNHIFSSVMKFSTDMVQSESEILLELQIYGLSFNINDEERIKEEILVGQSMTYSSYSCSSHQTNGFVDKMNLYSEPKPSISLGVGRGVVFAVGLTGMCNLGNTCFMNSAIQCLAHTPKLVDYFLGDFRKDLNFENPLGMNGKLAMAFGDLLRKLWAPTLTSVAPRKFKSTISSFAPQFSGYNQHDAQEFLAFLLDGLHEDLNRVKNKPYVQAKDDYGRSVDDVANEYWANHLSRNDSIVVDLCQGQYRSTLVCPVCKKSSITFDPFMYLSLPLPSKRLREITFTVLSTNGTSLPHPVTITVPYYGTSKDLTDALGTACSLRDDEVLLVAEIFRNSILFILDDPSGSIELIRDDDRLVAYRLPKETDGLALVEFIHQRDENKFGIPLVAKISDFSKGSEIHKEFLKLINPFLIPVQEHLNKSDASEKSSHDDEVMEDAGSDVFVNSDDEARNNLNFCTDFEYHLVDETSVSRCIKIQMDEPVPINKTGNRIRVLVTWAEKMIEDYDTSVLSLLPEVSKHEFFSKKPQNTISLYNCVDAFLKEEPLGPEDMWYCPSCKDHRQASKKLDIWRSPEILVVHLKRFSYNQLFKSKLETFVDFPIGDFDLSNYIIDKSGGVSCRYELYGVSSHYGSMGGGHYTAFANLGRIGWYEFDDSHVSPVAEDKIKTQAAYVLFYKRV